MELTLNQEFKLRVIQESVKNIPREELEKFAHDMAREAIIAQEMSKILLMEKLWISPDKH